MPLKLHLIALLRKIIREKDDFRVTELRLIEML